VTGNWKLEIAVTALEDAYQAKAGGADSIEISQDLAQDGLTPSFDLVRAVLDQVAITTNVIVRPHSRSFVYDAADVAIIMEQVKTLVEIGVHGIVFGAQTADGRIDVDLVKRVAEASGDIPVTLHRALDLSRDPESALDVLRGIIPRVLTAGPARTAWDGREGLRHWVQNYKGVYQFVVSGGLTLAQLPEMVQTVCAAEYHFGGAARLNGIVDSRQVQQLRGTLNR